MLYIIIMQCNGHGSKLVLLARDLFRWKHIWLSRTPPRVEKWASWLKFGLAGWRPVSVETHLAGTALGPGPRPPAKKKIVSLGPPDFTDNLPNLQIPSWFYRLPPNFTNAIPILQIGSWFYRCPPDFTDALPTLQMPSWFYRCPADFTDCLPILKMPPDFHVRPPAFYVSPPTFLTSHIYPSRLPGGPPDFTDCRYGMRSLDVQGERLISGSSFWAEESRMDSKEPKSERTRLFFTYFLCIAIILILILNKAYDINCLRGTRVPRQYTVQQFTQFLMKLAPCAISCSMQLYDQLCSHDKVAHPQQSSEICPVPSWNRVFQSPSDFGCAQGGRWRADVRWIRSSRLAGSESWMSPM